MASIYPAHIKYVDDVKQVQTVSEHCRGVAERAGELLENIGLEKAAYLIGLIHDLGKNTNSFKDYIEKAAAGEKVQRGSVNHTFAGVRFLLEKHNQECPAEYRDIVLEILAYAVGAHHGLFDCIDEQKRNGFTIRTEKEDIDYERAVQEFLTSCSSKKEIDELLAQTEDEIAYIFNKINDMAKNNDEDVQNVQGTFYIGFLARLLLSAIIEADRSDTARFMDGLPDKPETDMFKIWPECIKNVEQNLNELQLVTSIQKTRSEISDLCAEMAKLESGIYRLNLPTGAGKTLTSLRYALHHALLHNKNRIFFVMPLLSIIEQNASVIRNFINNNDFILEHHSNVVQTKDDDELDEKELLTESWNAPVVITTLVQMLNSLFAGKTTNIRRMQALCNSIIIIDEVQSVPNKMLSLFNLALNFLSKACNSTIILCSATQPCFEETTYALDAEVKDLVTLSEKQKNVFKRVKLLDAGSYDMEELTEFVNGLLEENKSVLVVCNTKNEAATIFNLIKSKINNVEAFHISAGMCMAHRQKTIKDLQDALEAAKNNPQKRVVCVATQVVEAGVDISFAIVIRLLAGLDNIVQAIGRENRNKEFEGLAPGYIVRLKGEKLKGLSDIEAAKNAAADLLIKYSENPDDYDNDLMSDKAARAYYKCLYKNMAVNYQDFYSEQAGDTILSLMSINQNADTANIKEYDKYFMHQAFKTAGGLFEVFDESSIDVIVPYGDGRNIIAELLALNKSEISKIKDLLKKAKLYTVSLFKWQKDNLEKQRAIIFVESAGVYILQEGYYDELSGLNFSQSEMSLQMV